MVVAQPELVSGVVLQAVTQRRVAPIQGPRSGRHDRAEARRCISRDVQGIAERRLEGVEVGVEGAASQEMHRDVSGEGRTGLGSVTEQRPVTVLEHREHGGGGSVVLGVRLPTVLDSSSQAR